MTIQHPFKKLILATFLAGTTSSIGSAALAQSFPGAFPGADYYYPSASFFSPTAYYYESDDAVDLSMTLDNENFATFKNNLQETKLNEALNQEETLTVLAPTEEAFAALSPELKQKLSEPETLKKVLQYHLVVGNIGEEDIKRRGVATLLEQNSVNITGVQGENKQVTVMLNDATAGEPLPAANGVVIPIDRVLIPPSLN